MPGSKTYTSNKVNELLEHDFLAGINDMEKHRLKGVSFSIFKEVLKLCLSLFFTTLMSMLTLSTKEENQSDLIFSLEVISIFTAVFIGFYILTHIIFFIGKWVFAALFNKRIFPAEKKKAYLIFHKKIVNHIYLGISFENKYNLYISNATNKIDDLNLDLASNYLSQSVHYFKIALTDIQDLIPPYIKGKDFREKMNAEFLDYIGFPLINVSLASAQRSLNRLLATESQVKDLTNSILANNNGTTIQLAYSSSIKGLFEEINSFINSYELNLERVLNLQKYLCEVSPE